MIWRPHSNSAPGELCPPRYVPVKDLTFAMMIKKVEKFVVGVQWGKNQGFRFLRFKPLFCQSTPTNPTTDITGLHFYDPDRSIPITTNS